jgi:hypothetical protein
MNTEQHMPKVSARTRIETLIDYGFACKAQSLSTDSEEHAHPSPAAAASSGLAMYLLLAAWLLPCALRLLVPASDWQPTAASKLQRTVLPMGTVQT